MIISDIYNSYFKLSDDIGRATYWKRTVVVVLSFILIMKVLPFIVNFVYLVLPIPGDIQSTAISVEIGKAGVVWSWDFVIFTLPLSTLLVFAIVALSMQRLRDRKRPVWLVIPLIVIPAALHLAFWIYNLHYPFSLNNSIGVSIAPGDWMHSPEYAFPRALVPVWNLLELEPRRFHQIYEQAILERNEFPLYFTRESMENLGVKSLWHVYLYFLIPAALLSLWGAIELGLLKGKK